MSESSPFRVVGDNEYRWPPEGFPQDGEVDDYVTYIRVSNFLKGCPNEYIEGWNVNQAVEWFVEHYVDIRNYVEAEALTSAPADGYFPLDQAWFDNELAKAMLQDAFMVEKRLRWDNGEIPEQKTRPKEADRVKTLLALTPLKLVAKYMKAQPAIVLSRLSRRGTAVHQMMEDLAVDGAYTDWDEEDLTAWISTGKHFLTDVPMEILEVESVVYSDTYGYAGQFDALIKVPTAWLKEQGWVDTRDVHSDTYDPDYVVVMVDYKTSPKMKSRVAQQFAAYGGADFIGRADGTKDPMPHIDEYWAVQITDKFTKIIPVVVDNDVFQYFLATRTNVYWTNDKSKTVLGKALKTWKAA